jgi:uncharacterized protein YbgA (DUF1722 family)
MSGTEIMPTNPRLSHKKSLASACLAVTHMTHIIGFLKEQIDSNDKGELLDVIAN